MGDVTSKPAEEDFDTQCAAVDTTFLGQLFTSEAYVSVTDLFFSVIETAGVSVQSFRSFIKLVERG